MGRAGKFLVGWSLALACGLVAHGPLGQADRFADRLQRQARFVVQDAELDRVSVAIEQRPLRRRIVLSGEADAFQREGQRRFPGLNDRIGGIPGVAAIRWTDEPGSGGFVLPLVVERLLLVSLAFLAGLLIGWRIFRPRPSFL